MVLLRTVNLTGHSSDIIGQWRSSQSFIVMTPDAHPYLQPIRVPVPTFSLFDLFQVIINTLKLFY